MDTKNRISDGTKVEISYMSSFRYPRFGKIIGYDENPGVYLIKYDEGFRPTFDELIGRHYPHEIRVAYA